MIKKLVFILIIIYFSLFNTYCDNIEDLLKDQLDNIDINEIEDFVREINRETEDFLPEINIRELIFNMFKGSALNNISEIGRGIINLFFKEVIFNFSILGKLLILTIICAVLQNLHNAFEEDAVGRLAYGLCYILIIIMAVGSFNTAMEIGKQTIDKMVVFMQAMLPTLLALLVSVGGISSSAVFQPLIFGSITFITTIIKNFVMPLVLFSAILSILDNLSESINISKLSSLLRQTAIGVLGIVLTVFTGIVSIQGVASTSIDNAAIRTAKFAVDSFIPIVGKFLSDAFDAVVSCSMILKNGIGIAGLIVLLIICSFPVVKMFSIIVIYKIASALIQPILDNQIVQCLNDMSNSMLVLLTCVISVAFMFFIALTVIMGIGNMAIMVR